MEKEEKMKLDYEQTTLYHHKLHDVRFKLLALVPIATGAAIGLIDKIGSGPKMLVIGVLGFFVTLGVTIYDQRNTQIYDAMQKRAKTLETLLDFKPLDENKNRGGAFLDRPDRGRRLFGFLLMWHDRALAIIYAAAFGGWTYLVVEGFIQSIGAIDHKFSVFGRIIIPVLVFILFLRALHEFDDPTDTPDSMSPEIKKLVYPDESTVK